MRIDCRHGFFLFDEDFSGEISRFASLFSLPIVRDTEFYTLEALRGAPRFSLAGATYLGAIAIKTFEGAPWEVMRENELVYDFSLGSIVPIQTVTTVIEVKKASGYYLASGLILPGSVTEDGARVTDYSARYSFDGARFKYSEIRYV